MNATIEEISSGENPNADQLVYPQFAPAQELRFAIVMYGGLSLAIYMNGVAQEFLNLVRATAPDTNGNTFLPEEKLQGSEKVYRRLGQLLGYANSKKTLSDVNPGDPIVTRFVVDVLSGTSAGGLNAVFLAKALASGKRMDQLTELWIDEADIGILMNDDNSFIGLPDLPRMDLPKSLLNSQRIYRKLYEAIHGMNSAEEPGKKPQYVEELDLYVTTTDMHGLIVPIKLADGVVHERRHRNVFHFKHATKYASGEVREDFRDLNDPFLAFAARCTSAHPAAFEPMSLVEIEDLVPANQRNEIKKFLHPAPGQAGSGGWTEFYEDYERKYLEEFYKAPYDEPVFSVRYFNDGGVLDNRPFTYATHELSRRRADVRVDRKLVYIEPAPDPIQKKSKRVKPHIIKNAIASLSSLPRYEPIREDLQNVLERNRQVRRINEVLRYAELDSDKFDVFWKIERSKRDPSTNWIQTSLPQMITTRGAAYGGYYRMKVASVTDELASLVTRLVGLDEDSDHFLAIRLLVKEWRKETFDEEAKKGKEPLNQFLLEFDLSYRLRRMRFLRAKIDEWLIANPNDKAVREKLKPVLIDSLKDNPEQFRATLVNIKKQLNQVFIDLRTAGRAWAAEKKIPFPNVISLEDLTHILRQPSIEECEKEAGNLLTKHKASLDDFRKKLSVESKEVYAAASSACQSILEPKNTDDSIRKELWRLYEYFEDYDTVLFPITYGTSVGESDEVEIMRISPYDANSIINAKEDDIRRLAGDTLAHFGAFFRKDWRQNDILWGRLDAAERIITLLLPRDEINRKRLIEQAHKYILKEMKQQTKFKELVDSKLVDVLLEEMPATDPGNKEKIKSALLKLRLAREETANLASRAAGVFSKMLSGLGIERGPLISRIGGAMTGFVLWAATARNYNKVWFVLSLQVVLMIVGFVIPKTMMFLFSLILLIPTLLILFAAKSIKRKIAEWLEKISEA